MTYQELHFCASSQKNPHRQYTLTRLATPSQIVTLLDTRTSHTLTAQKQSEF